MFAPRVRLATATTIRGSMWWRDAKAPVPVPASTSTAISTWSSLAKALGRPAEPTRWAILHLGSIQASDFPEGRDIAVFDAKGVAVADQTAALKDIEGVVIFDGTWSQAKTLWWRNAWVLKARRVALRPAEPSLYGKLRKEPRKEGLSSIEAAGMVLARLERRPEIEASLRDAFAQMLSRYRGAKKAGLVGKG